RLPRPIDMKPMTIPTVLLLHILRVMTRPPAHQARDRPPIRPIRPLRPLPPRQRPDPLRDPEPQPRPPQPILLARRHPDPKPPPQKRKKTEPHFFPFFAPFASFAAIPSLSAANNPFRSTLAASQNSASAFGKSSCHPTGSSPTATCTSRTNKSRSLA